MSKENKWKLINQTPIGAPRKLKIIKKALDQCKKSFFWILNKLTMEEASQPADVMLVRVEMNRTAATAQKWAAAQRTKVCAGGWLVICSKIKGTFFCFGLVVFWWFWVFKSFNGRSYWSIFICFPCSNQYLKKIVLGQFGWNKKRSKLT